MVDPIVEPLVLIGFIARNAEKTIPRFLEQIDNLDYPKNRLRYACVEGGSTDKTREIILDWMKPKKNTFFIQHDMDDDKLSHRERMFCSSNLWRHYVKTRFKGVEPVDYVFQCDADVIGIPSETLKTLINLDVDIVAPYIYVDQEKHPRNIWETTKTFSDIWGYRHLYGPYPGLQFNSSIHEYYKRNLVRDKSIRADTEKRLLPMQSVGANPILVKREVYEKVWYTDCKATPGWCDLARTYGFKVWAYPDIECIHDWRVLLDR